MNLSAPFVKRPIGTTLLTIGLAIAGVAAFFLMPVANLPSVDFPAVSVSASLPGASPETMATSVAGPLERHLAHIADVDQMTSSSRVGQSQVSLTFGLDRNIDGAARDVQAAINAAAVDLPSTLRSHPTYRKANASATPIMVLALTSSTLQTGQIYDAASNIIVQKLSQITGVGDVQPQGASLPAVRVELNPYQLAHYGIGLEDVRAALASANANRPKGIVQQGDERLQIYTNDAGTVASDYAPLVIAYRNGAAVRLSDISDVIDAQENVRVLGLYNGSPAVIVQVISTPGANIPATVDAVKQVLPSLEAALPGNIKLDIAVDRTTAIRASLKEVERTLVIAVLLVIVVVAVFLRSASATLVPAVAVTVSLLGTIGVMFLLGFSLDNLSLMALTVSTGFVVDDAIVVLENITRHVERGVSRFEAALLGAREVGFTVVSISISLIAVFLPILLMGGYIGKLFHEFAMTMSIAIMVSLVISLTTTPMICAYWVHTPAPDERPNILARASLRTWDVMARIYERSLRWSLDSGPVMIVILLATICLNFYLWTVVPKGLFPQQSNGLLQGFMQTDSSTSFRLTQQRMRQYVDIIKQDPAVAGVIGFTGGAGAGGQVVVSLKPLADRDNFSDAEVVARLRRKMFSVVGSNMFLQSPQDVRAGGRQSNATYQYTLKADDLNLLKTWTAKLADELKRQPLLSDVNTDQEDHGLESFVTVDRDTAGRLGLSAIDVDNTLYDAFGQRQVSTIYKDLNQYHVIMEVGPAYNQSPDALSQLYLSTNKAAGSTSTATSGASAASTTTTSATTTSAAAPGSNPLATAATSGQFAATPGGPTVAGGAQITLAGPLAPPSRNAANGVAVSSTVEQMIPLSAFAHFAPSSAPTAVNHQDGTVAATISFSLDPGRPLGDALPIIQQAEQNIHMPTTIQGGFQGTAKLFQQAFGNLPILVLVALLVIYIVLGVLYESYVHPLTVLSTLPSAGVGAALALILFKTEFSLVGFIGIMLLIGIVKKNAILIIDFAIDAERGQGLSTRDAVYQACMLRFRPIMMTTFAAILGALPLVISSGEGSELRRPLGITIIGGLMVSQVLTLLTTPVVYLYLDRWRKRRGDQSYLSRVIVGPPPLEPQPSPA